MPLSRSRVTSQGQISIPAAVRRKLGIGPGSILEWDEDGGKIVVRRSGTCSSQDIHRALFAGQTPKPRTLGELKEGFGTVFGSGMRSVDTNVLARLITRDDPRQATAADGFIEQGAWVSVVALTEAMCVLGAVYELGARDIATCLEMLLNHKTLTIQDADVVAAALELFRSKPSLGFSDCLILHLSKKAGHVPLGTFDRGLAKAEGTKRL